MSPAATAEPEKSPRVLRPLEAALDLRAQVQQSTVNPHVGKPAGFRVGEVQGWVELGPVHAVVDVFPELIVDRGSFCICVLPPQHDGDAVAIHRPEYRDVARQLMDRFPQPWFAVPGNHDVGSCVGWHHHDTVQLSTAGAAFAETFGPANWTLEQARFRIIAVNNQIFGADIPDACKQAEWLADELAVESDLLRTVLFHTPPYLETPNDDFDDGSEMMCLHPAARKPLLDVLHQNPPQLLVMAHARRFWQKRGPNWGWLGLPATAFGQHELEAVPSRRLPSGDDAISWVELQRAGTVWKAVHYKVPDEISPPVLQ